MCFIIIIEEKCQLLVCIVSLFVIFKFYLNFIFQIQKPKVGFVMVFFSLQIFFHKHLRFTGQQGKGGGAISLILIYHFYPLHRHFSRVITSESSPLHIAGSRTQTGEPWFTGANHKPLSYAPLRKRCLLNESTSRQICLLSFQRFSRKVSKQLPYDKTCAEFTRSISDFKQISKGTGNVCGNMPSVNVFSNILYIILNIQYFHEILQTGLTRPSY